MTFTSLDLICRRYVRIALTFILMAWTGAGDLGSVASEFESFGTTEVQHVVSVRLMIPPPPAWSYMPRSRPRQPSPAAIGEDSEPEDANPRFTVRLKLKRAAQGTSQSLTVISPDYLFELPGTPPPTLRL